MKIFIILIEMVLVSFLVLRLYKMSKQYKQLGKEGTFLEKMETILNQSLPKNVATIVIREVTMIYYLFTRNKKINVKGNETFSYHKGTGYLGILCAFIFVILIESVGLFFLFHNWSPILSWIHFAFNIYAVLFLISDYRAILQRPIVITDKDLSISVGTRRKLTVPLENISAITDGRDFENEKKNKKIFKAVLLEFEMPQFAIQLKEPVGTSNFLGKPQNVDKVYVTVDDRDRFYQSLLARTEREKN